MLNFKKDEANGEQNITNALDPNAKVYSTLNINVNRGRIFFDGTITKNGVVTSPSVSFDNLEAAVSWFKDQFDVH